LNEQKVYIDLAQILHLFDTLDNH